MKSKSKIFIVDDHPLVREWLTNLLNDEDDLTVCGAAETATQAKQMVEALKPDVAVVDITLGNELGIDLIREIKARSPGTAVIVLSMHEESLYAERALLAGALGYVMKKEMTTRIVEGIRQVSQGDYFFSKKFSKLLASGPGALPRSPVGTLSDRELEVFRLLGKGNETRQIAGTLQLSINTVQVYCSRIKEKLKLENATELVREAALWVKKTGA